MYSRVTEFQSTSKTHCDMIIAFFQNVMIPRNLKNGMLSSEIYRVSDTQGFLMSTFKSKNDANSIMKMVAKEINEVKGNIKIKFIERCSVDNNKDSWFIIFNSNWSKHIQLFNHCNSITICSC